MLVKKYFLPIIISSFLFFVASLEAASSITAPRRGLIATQKQNQDMLNYTDFRAKGQNQDWGFFLNAGYLYWRGRNEGWIPYRKRGDSEKHIPSSFHYGTHGWDSGCKVAAGFKDKKWDVKALWTHADIDGSSERTIDPADGVFSDIFYGGYFYNVKDSQDIGYDTLDCLVGHRFYFTKHFWFHPFFGFRGIIVDQTFKFYGKDAIEFDLIYLNIKVQADFIGIGPRAGFDIDWEIYKGLSFYGGIGCSLPWGKEKGRLFFAAEDNDGNVVDYPALRIEKHELKSAADAIIGLAYTCWYNKQTSFFRMALGWEFNYYWDMYPVFQFGGDRGSYMLSKGLEMQGLVAEVAFQF